MNEQRIYPLTGIFILLNVLMSCHYGFGILFISYLSLIFLKSWTEAWSKFIIALPKKSFSMLSNSLSKSKISRIIGGGVSFFWYK
jgi:hypothetical protein